MTGARPIDALELNLSSRQSVHMLNNDTTKQATGKLRQNETLHPLGHVRMSDFLYETY